MAAAVLAAAATVGAEFVGAMAMNTAFQMTAGIWAKMAFSASMALLAGGLSESGSGRQEAPSFTAEARSRTQMIRASTEPRRVIYGSAPVSGVLVFADSTGDSNKFLHLVICLAGHQSQALNDIIFNDEVVGGYDAASGMFTTGRYAGKVRIRKHLGAVDQTPDADLNAESTKWAAKYRPLRGITYIAVRLEYDRDVFPTGIPNIRANVDGKNTVWDVRTGNYGWYNNAALCQLDYILWLYGMRCTVAEIDSASWIAAANISDENVALPGGGTQKRYVCNGTFTLDRNPGDVLRELRTASAGALIYRMGKWYGYAGAADVATQTLNEDDLRAPLKIRRYRPKRELFNAVRGLFFNPDDHDQLTDFPPVTSEFYEGQDDGKRIYGDVQYPFTDDVYAAQRLAKIELERHRQQITGTFPAKLRGLRIVPWRPVKLNIGLLGFEDKLFRITNWRLTEDGGVDLDYEEYSAATWDWNAGMATTVDTAPNTTLPSLFEGLEIASIACASGTPQLFVAGDGTVVSRIEASWPAPGNPYVRRYLVQHKPGTASEWTDAAPVIAGDATARTTIAPVQDGVAYQVRVRAETSAGNRGPWLESAEHVVAGKSAPPSDPTGFTALQNGAQVVFKIDRSPDADFGVFEIRRSPLGVIDWDTAVRVGRADATIIPSEVVPPGEWSFLCRTFDRSENPSVGIARADLVVTNGHDVIFQPEQAPDWTGCTLVNLVKHWSGVLLVQGQAAADTQGWETFEPGVPDPYATASVEAAELDLGFDTEARLWADWLGSSPAIALEADYRTTAGAYAGFRPWSVGEVVASAAKMRLTIATAMGQPQISSFTPVVDAAEYTQSANLTIAAGGSAVTFATPFHFTPALAVFNTSGSPLIPAYSSLTATGATLHLYNLSGTSVGGAGRYEATGV